MEALRYASASVVETDIKVSLRDNGDEVHGMILYGRLVKYVASKASKQVSLC